MEFDSDWRSSDEMSSTQWKNMQYNSQPSYLKCGGNLHSMCGSDGGSSNPPQFPHCCSPPERFFDYFPEPRLPSQMKHPACERYGEMYSGRATVYNNDIPTYSSCQLFQNGPIPQQYRSQFYPHQLGDMHHDPCEVGSRKRRMRRPKPYVKKEKKQRRQSKVKKIEKIEAVDSSGNAGMYYTYSEMITKSENPSQERNETPICPETTESANQEATGIHPFVNRDFIRLHYPSENKDESNSISKEVNASVIYPNESIKSENFPEDWNKISSCPTIQLFCQDTTCTHSFINRHIKTECFLQKNKEEPNCNQNLNNYLLDNKSSITSKVEGFHQTLSASVGEDNQNRTIKEESSASNDLDVSYEAPMNVNIDNDRKNSELSDQTVASVEEKPLDVTTDIPIRDAIFKEAGFKNVIFQPISEGKDENGEDVLVLLVSSEIDQGMSQENSKMVETTDFIDSKTVKEERTEENELEVSYEVPVNLRIDIKRKNSESSDQISTSVEEKSLDVMTDTISTEQDFENLIFQPMFEGKDKNGEDVIVLIAFSKIHQGIPQENCNTVVTTEFIGSKMSDSLLIKDEVISSNDTRCSRQAEFRTEASPCSTNEMNSPQNVTSETLNDNHEESAEMHIERTDITDFACEEAEVAIDNLLQADQSKTIKLREQKFKYYAPRASSIKKLKPFHKMNKYKRKRNNRIKSVVLYKSLKNVLISEMVNLFKAQDENISRKKTWEIVKNRIVGSILQLLFTSIQATSKSTTLNNR